MKFLVVSTPRSATKYMARVLTAAGMPCGHETCFGYVSCWSEVFHNEPVAEPHIGDSSWLAAPFLVEVPRDTVILYQMRRPELTLRSIAAQNIGRELFLAPGQWVRDTFSWWDWPRDSHGSLESIKQTVILFWTEWHRMIESQLDRFNTVIRYRAEEIDLDLIRDIADAVDRPFGIQRAREALGQTPKNENTRGPVEVTFDYREIPDEIWSMWESHHRNSGGFHGGNSPYKHSKPVSV